MTARGPRVALLCSGLGNVFRGHEAFAQGLIELLSGSLDLVVFKGGGQSSERQIVLPHVRRDAPGLEQIKLPVSPRWHASEAGQERMRVECETFAYAALGPLLEGDFDVIHCLDRDVCNVIYANRHLFRKTPRVLFSNGGAMPARDLPRCDFVQEHSAHNLRYSARGRAFLIPHGVDLERFRPGIKSDMRQRLGIAEGVPLLISVGTICYWHKRMDHVIREVAASGDAWHLLIVGQEDPDSPAIKALGQELLGDRVRFTTLPHAELPAAYAAADAFVLGSLFETFGIAYIEAMAMALPVISTDHPNQKGIVQEGLFVDMRKPGELARLLREADRTAWAAIGQRGRRIVEQQYDLHVLQRQYLQKYAEIAATPVELPRYHFGRRVSDNLRGAWRQLQGLVQGQAE